MKHFVKMPLHKIVRRTFTILLHLEKMQVDFTQVKDLGKFLTAKKHWVFCSHNREDWDPSNVTADKIQKCMFLNKDGYLEFYRSSKEPNDKVSGHTLRPRIELVMVHSRLPKLVPLHIHYRFAVLEGGKSFRGMVFQIMDHENDKKGTLPSQQLEMRHGKLHARYTVISENGKGKNTHIHHIHTPIMGEFMDVDIYTLLSHKQGYYHVYVNGEKKFSRSGINASEHGGDPAIQFGIYAVKGVECRTQVHKLEWSREDMDSATESSESSSEEKKNYEGTYEVIIKKK